MLDKGILIYAKSPTDISRGKKHGSLDIGLSVISTKDKRRRIDIDAEEFIYHLKAKTIETFNCWVEQLKAHRLYRHHILTYGLRDVPLIRATSDDDTPITRNTKFIGKIFIPGLLLYNVSQRCEIQVILGHGLMVEKRWLIT